MLHKEDVKTIEMEDENSLQNESNMQLEVTKKRKMPVIVSVVAIIIIGMVVIIKEVVKAITRKKTD